MSDYLYLKDCPRGFANEYTIYRVPLTQKAEAEAEYANYEDAGDGRYAKWVSGQYDPATVVDWADRNF